VNVDFVDAGDAALPLVCLVGRPNVGKSSLFNRLVGGRPALVEDRPGLTRDRRYGVCDWDGARFRVVDTGGLDSTQADPGLWDAMRAQTLFAVEEAALLVCVLDAREGVTPLDKDAAQILRRTGKPVFVAVNKVDSAGPQAASSEVYRLGFDHVFPMSATHGRGIGDFLDAVVRVIGKGGRPAAGDSAAAEGTSAPVRLVFVGKPNVGKSSLVNALLGQDRVVVHDQPGTTRDPVDTRFSLGGREFVLVDTAGMRRRARVETYTEAVAAKMARDQIARADVVALVIDVQTGPTAEDARFASLIDEAGRGMLVVLNKSDTVSRAAVDTQVDAIRETLKFIEWAPVLVTSAHTGRSISKIAEQAAEVYQAWSLRVPTGKLNRHFETIVARRPPPAQVGGRHVRLYYVTQASVRPPTFFISTNAANAVGQAYRRYLQKQLRAVGGFRGSPIRVVLKANRAPRKPG
jgi:GTP-binding protein